jgi:hypothetical protein
MEYGNFVNSGSVYRVTTPKTPSIWTNYLFNDTYHMEVSQTLQGQSSLVSNYSRRPCTTDYRYFYIYDHDSKAQVDMNVVMTEHGDIIEVQGTAEGKTFSRTQLNEMLDLAEAGIKELISVQRAALEII